LNDLQDVEAERFLLGSLLNNVEAIEKIDISANDFYGIGHQHIFSVIQELYMQDIKRLDIPTVAKCLEKKGYLEESVPIAMLTDLFGLQGITDNIGRYAEQIKDMSKRRFFWKLAKRISERIHDRTLDIKDIEMGIANSLDKVQTDDTEDMEIQDLIYAFHQQVTEENKEKIYASGFKVIDANMKMQKGNLIILAGRPAMGKTALALNIIANVCGKGGGVMFFSLEMSKEEITKRMVSIAGRIPQENLKPTKYRSDDDMKRLLGGENKLFPWNLSIIEKGNCTIHDMKVKAKARKKKKGLDLIVIDYLQLMSAEGFLNNRVAEISYLTRNLKLLAKDLGIPILVLSQLSRAVESRNQKRPMLSDLRDSGSIEQDADIVMLMYRDRYYNENGDEWTEVNIAKNRHGGNGVARLKFYPPTLVFSDW
jgi:replicative DNA helicase